MNNQLDLDVRIDQQQAAIARAEQDAVRITERLKAIPGCEGLLKQRRSYGQIPNPWAGSGNMTAQAAIIRADRTLAAWLAAQAGTSIPAPDYEAEAERERWAESARNLERQTEAMRSRNAVMRQQQERASTYGSWNPQLGRVV